MNNKNQNEGMTHSVVSQWDEILADIKERAESPSNEWHQGYLAGAQFARDNVALIPEVIELIENLKTVNSHISFGNQIRALDVLRTVLAKLEKK